MTTGQYISSLSKAKGLTQSDVARQIGLSRQILSYIISGKREMTLPQALRLESLFSLKQGTLVRMQDGERIKNHTESIPMFQIIGQQSVLVIFKRHGRNDL